MKVNIVTIPEGYGSERKMPSARLFSSEESCIQILSDEKKQGFASLLDVEDFLEQENPSTAVYIVTQEGQKAELLAKYQDNEFVTDLISTFKVSG